MNCNRCVELINDYIDGFVNEFEKEIIKDHIDSCDKCKEEYEDMLIIKEALNDMPTLELPEGFNEELHAKLIEASEEMKNEKKVISFSKFSPSKIMANKKVVTALGIAASFVIVVGGSNLLNDSGMFEKSLDVAVYNEGNFDEGNRGVDSFEATSEVAPQVTNLKNATPEVSVTFTESNGLTSMDATEDSNNYTMAGTADRMIISTANMGIEVESFDDTFDEISNMTKALGGYIENSNYSTREITPYYPVYSVEADGAELEKAEPIFIKNGYMNIRVPREHLENVVSQVEELGVVSYLNMGSQDVTETYSDLSNKTANLEAQEKRLRELMERADKVEDVIQIERELSSVRTQIDNLKSRMMNYENRSTLASLSIQINEKEKAPDLKPIDVKLSQRIKDGFINSINFVVTSGEKFIVWIVSAIPMFIVVGIVFSILTVIYKLILKSIRRGKKKKLDEKGDDENE